MVAISALKIGDTVWSVTRQKSGNTTITRQVCHPVYIVAVADSHVIARWNGNMARRFSTSQVAKWRRTKPA
ncbi:hypothetical protein GCM10019059_40880 [Camelimonas fluminis]|uniref:Uncharacterized protein n=1 Tax=Camelimonas fluminis TaxID=1576911 RepID=A0ABV7UCA4_9HYPH|nr:hypothetical protein [Camelimonas fluminis]GHE77719.1 hypothetical protein GCM10019059_40880 [Camelimonas fluminis]